MTNFFYIINDNYLKLKKASKIWETDNFNYYF